MSLQVWGVHVEDTVKSYMKFNKGASCWSTLYDYITMQGTNNIKSIMSHEYHHFTSSFVEPQTFNKNTICIWIWDPLCLFIYNVLCECRWAYFWTEYDTAKCHLIYYNCYRCLQLNLPVITWSDKKRIENSGRKAPQKKSCKHQRWMESVQHYVPRWALSLQYWNLQDCSPNSWNQKGHQLLPPWHVSTCCIFSIF